MERLKMPEGEPIEHTLVTRSIESAQRKVEAHNFDIRKQLLEYDNVANDQRKNVYELRNRILENQGLAEMVKGLRDGVVTDVFRAHVPAESVEEQWDIPGLETDLHVTVGLHIPAKKWLEEEPNLGDETLLERIVEASDAAYAARMSQVPPDAVAHTERYVLLQILDQHWREHLAALDHLRQGIHLRGYAQKNPKQEYKREAFELFGAMLETVKLEVTRVLTHLELKTPEQVREIERLEAEARAPEKVQYQHPALEEALVGAGAEGEAEEQVATLRKPAPFVRQMGKVGRNDPCPCGSGKKFKHCHGRLS
jgi:preprotein translocase subunit SecA